MKGSAAIFALLLLGAHLSWAGQTALPIYLEDNHAGAFYWLAQHLDPEEHCTLLHFDAHSDASGVFDSDKLRERLRRVDSLEERAQLLGRWREQGVVQCFGWIEPLLPTPIAQVIWIPPDEQTLRQTDAVRQLDGHLGAAPRAAGSFASRYRSTSLESLEKEFTITGPLVASLDLDYFAEIPPNERSAAFERIWKFIAERRNLRAVAIAISRPYLESDQEADELVRLALKAALSLPTARIQFEPFRSVGHDRSQRAREFRARNQEVPAYRLTSSSPELRSLLSANRGRIHVQSGNDRWQTFLRQWESEVPQFHLAIKNHAPSTDNIWRLPAAEKVEVEVRATPWTTSFEKVQWLAEIPVYERCNLVSEVDDGSMFARGAPPRPRWREVELAATGKSILLPQQEAWGAMRIKARVGGMETPAIDVRRFARTGFRAALSEQFGLPYLFGSGSLRAGGNTGPEAGWGADCSNFIVYALRRQGRPVPWSNPKQLRQYLEPSGMSFSAADLERGLIVHFGSHVAAVMEDRPPLGVLNAEDIVAHQLEGPSQMLSLGDLLRARGYRRFDLLRVPPATERADLIIGGDVMLGRSVGAQIRNGVDPFAGIRALLNGADTVVANLECVVSDEGKDEGTRKFSLRAPVEAAGVLKAAGFGVMGLANNHADDFGSEALTDSINHLRTAGLAVIGSPNESYIVRGSVAFFAVNDVAQRINRPVLAAALRRARIEAKSVVALVHWGDENTAWATGRQRELARWLIDHGVDLIAGSHPHCLQATDFYHGRPIFYSLGNLVFDGAPTLASWNAGALLQVGFHGRNSSPVVKLIPIQLDVNGFPHPKSDRVLTQR